ncbi:MAG TPA: DUF2752 domain-containing protein [Blastocatellia bacterium]|nr:DUF2752 domain-containing protein [Blastocatellia bacterium]
MEVDSAITHQIIEEVQPAVEQPSRKLAVFGLVGLFAVFLASVLFTPPDGEYFSVCGFKNFTGLPCPGCGLTHSFCALGKGEVSGAFGFNLLGPPLFLVLVSLWIRSACVLLNKTDAVQLLDRIAGRFNVVRAFAYGFAVYGVARIVYMVAYHPVTFRDSPLSQLIVRLIH